MGRPDGSFAIVWRADDEALLLRLENEQIMQLVWRELAAEAPPPHARANGLIHLLRESPEGDRAALAAMEGDRAALRALLFPASFGAARAPLLHHFALLFGAAARASQEKDPARALVAHQRATAAWIALSAEQKYLEGLVAAVAGEALSEVERAEVVAAAPFADLRALAAEGRRSGGDRSAIARLALRVLGSVEEAIRISGAGQSNPSGGRTGPAERARLECRRLRLEILDTALEALADGLDVATGQTPGREHLALLDQGVDTWEWADCDFEVESFLVERAMPIGWELYNAKRWDPLRRMVGILRRPIDSLAVRVENDPSKLPYAARCAQMLVFRAEMEPRLDDQLVAAARAVKLCPTHRNGRLVYADLLAERALRTMEGGPLLQRSQRLESARQDVELAKSLWPQGTRVKSAEDALARNGVKL